LITSTENYLTECRKSLESNRVNLENLNESLSDKTEQCNAWAAEYAASSSEMERELEILNLLREHIVEKGEQVKGYLGDRAANAPGLWEKNLSLISN